MGVAIKLRHNFRAWHQNPPSLGWVAPPLHTWKKRIRNSKGEKVLGNMEISGEMLLTASLRKMRSVRNVQSKNDKSHIEKKTLAKLHQRRKENVKRSTGLEENIRIQIKSENRNERRSFKGMV